MVNALFSWPVIGALVTIFIGIGGRAMRITSSSLVAKICFSAAGLIFLIKFGTWISSESFALKWRIIVAFIIFGTIGIGWVLSWQWADTVKRVAQEKEGKQAYVGRLEAEEKIILSPSQHIYPIMEFDNIGVIVDGEDLKAILRIAEDNNLLIEDDGGKIRVSIKVRDQHGKMIAEIIKNEWKVGPPPSSWDRNYSQNALEVLDPTGDVVLQVKLVENRVQFQAKLYNSTGNGIGFGKILDPEKGWVGMIEFAEIGKPITKLKIEPIFKYPSALHLGEFVETQ